MVGFEHDPLGWVEYSFPWGSGELANETGPRDWQRDTLISIGEQLKAGADREQVIREAIASGHGIGKSALVAWLILWAMSTKVDTKGVVTANTERQLKTKTWAELGKWHRLSICSHQFEFTATALFCSDKEFEKTWRVDQVVWSERNTEAFAGLHNKGNRILLVFDEASGIPDTIWEVSEGALTDEETEIIWVAFGNPTRNSGRFKMIFGRLRHRWKTRHIDSRDVPGTNKKQIQEWVDDYGEDSDFVRVRVRGVFPRAGSNQFIGGDIVKGAQDRELPDIDLGHRYFDPIIVGVDVARFGDDQSVIKVRIGRDARSIAPLKFSGMDTVQLAARVAAVIDGELTNGRRADACFVDGGGVGGGVVDRLNEMNYDVTEVNFGERSNDRKYLNMRSNMWGNMKEWLQIGCIDSEMVLEDDLTGPEYNYNLKNQIVLEKKSDMKLRGLASPDEGDALAVTFAHPVGPRESITDTPNTVTHSEFNPYA
ncbi:MAG: terminase [Gammaproteobacteria bacterium]|nr:terminase [Gammaproteobacteria bacterium]